MRGGEGYDVFLKNIKKNLFESRFDRASPEKKKGITYTDAKHLLKVFLINQSNGQLTTSRAKKMADAEIERLKQTIHRLERNPSYKQLPILRKKRKSPRRTIKRQRSLQARKPRHPDEKRYYMTRFKNNKTKKSITRRSLHHSISPSEKWGTV
tara:strand:+ start:695 stop:1153 length:459 start_codon:yes stop_codon:yes gene_type:complete